MNVAVINGASSGIGRELCLLLQDRIPAIQEFWFFSRNRSALDELSHLFFRKVKIFPYDLTKKESLSQYKETLRKENPKILFLVNAAGFGKLGEACSLSSEEQLNMIDLNVKALTAFTLYSLPYMRRKSRIIQFASAAAFLPQREFSVYAATKAYVYSFSLSLREELKHKEIGVTTVCPGPVDTAFFSVAGNESKLKAIKSFFMANPKKVAKTALVDSVLDRPLSIYGFPMKVFYILSQIIPDEFLLLLLRKLYR